MRAVFIDYVEIKAAAGNGGAGCMSFRREKFVAKGGPDGGDGGRGGDIVAVTDPNLSTLLDYRYRRHYRAENGRPGEGSLKTGKSSSDMVLRLPVGTIVIDRETGAMIADLDDPDAREIIARGGTGGRGNAYFKSPTNQAPREAQPGQAGEKRKLALELKLLADVGLVGQPNAGKSTILATFSAARPKIADYPFTTLVPNLGIVRLREFKSCVMADIPGLIEGAAAGKGLGHQFLKHIQRTRLLVYIIDVNEPDVLRTLGVLQQELADFDHTLLDRPSFVVITKIDTITQGDLKKLSNNFGGGYLWLSAVTGMGAEKFLLEVERQLDQQRIERTPG